MASPAGYSRAQIALHWIIALLIVAQYLFHENMKQAFQAIVKGEADAGGFHPHAVTGLIILLLVIWRLVLRHRRGVPDQPAGVSALQELAAIWTHRILYALLILIPVSGMTAWNTGAQTAAAAHGTMFFMALAMILLHILVAAYHQWVLKDGLIRRMMKAG